MDDATPTHPAKKSSRDRVRAHRARMRSEGKRLVQHWLPDTRTPEFKAEARRQALLIANSPGEADDLAFIESLYDEALFGPGDE